MAQQLAERAYERIRLRLAEDTYVALNSDAWQQWRVQPAPRGLQPAPGTQQFLADCRAYACEEGLADEVARRVVAYIWRKQHAHAFSTIFDALDELLAVLTGTEADTDFWTTPPAVSPEEVV